MVIEEQEDISIVSFLLNYVVNTILIGFIVYLLIKIYRSRCNVPVIESLQPAPKMKRRDFTIAELRAFDGTDNTPILVAVNGKVFDVTNRGKQFYGPGGTYNVFAGRDATRGLATFSLRLDENVQQEYDDLEGLDMEAVKEWEIQFSEKYDLVGKLLKPGEEHTSYSDDEDTLQTDELNTKENNGTKTDKKLDDKKED